MSHDCSKEEFLGRVKEFMDNTKGVRGTLLIIALTIFIQVVGFVYLWGGINNNVANLNKTVDMMCAKIDKLTSIVYAGEMKNGR